MFFLSATMNPTNLHAISPIDGRYHHKIANLANYFSEAALIKYRVKIEIIYFKALCEIPLAELKHFDTQYFKTLNSIYIDFNDADAQKIKELEKKTNHDVKAVEYFIKERFELLGLAEFKEFIHFGLTSQDINNTAIPLSLKEAVQNCYLVEMEVLMQQLYKLADAWKEVPMLARTHGQAASPTDWEKKYKFL